MLSTIDWDQFSFDVLVRDYGGQGRFEAGIERCCVTVLTWTQVVCIHPLPKSLIDKDLIE